MTPCQLLLVYNARMANLGHYNTLTILRRTDVGLFVDGGELGDILLPRKYVTDSMQVGEHIEVFLYSDSEDRMVATTLRPHAQVGEYHAGLHLLGAAGHVRGRRAAVAHCQHRQ